MGSAKGPGARYANPESIGLGTQLAYHTTLEAMNLDARIRWLRHVTLVRRGGIRAVQFTPRDIAQFERQLGSLLGERSDWALDESGWRHGLTR